MKKLFYFSMIAAGMFFIACSDEDLVVAPNKDNPTAETQRVMSFNVNSKNLTRATALQEIEVYGFGVWALKSSSDDSNNVTTQDVMTNYLVGYYNEYKQKGYYGAAASTIGDSIAQKNDTAMWFYEGLGKNEYSYSGSGGYSTTSPSIHDNQYLKYWDLESDSTEFFASVPYMDTVTTSTSYAKFDSVSKTLSITGLTGGWSLDNNYMLAYSNVRKRDYKKDVSLIFKHINAKVRLAFYETIPGYNVKITSVHVENAHLNDEGKMEVNASTDTIVSGGNYKIDANNNIVTIGTRTTSHFATDNTNSFGVPSGSQVNNQGKHTAKYDSIATTRAECVKEGSTSQCPNTYYAMPCSSNGNSGLKVKVGFTLYSLDTNETINIVDSVYVAGNKDITPYTEWTANTYNLYVFRLTKNASGLYPIVFDGIRVQDYEKRDAYTWIINPDANEVNPEVYIESPTTTVSGYVATFNVTMPTVPGTNNAVASSIRLTVTATNSATVTAQYIAPQAASSAPRRTRAEEETGAEEDPTWTDLTLTKGVGTISSATIGEYQFKLTADKACTLTAHIEGLSAGEVPNVVAYTDPITIEVSSTTTPEASDEESGSNE